MSHYDGTVWSTIEVLTPIANFRSLFDRNGRLTRLATFISPEEMTSDPVFVTNASLPDVDPKHLAVAHVMCGDGAPACAARTLAGSAAVRHWPARSERPAGV